jgi:hypothetical protein
MEARRKKASALRLRHSQSLASLRQRLSAFGDNLEADHGIGAFNDFNVERGEVAGAPELYGFLLAGIGIGAVSAVFTLPALKQRIGAVG